MRTKKILKGLVSFLTTKEKNILMGNINIIEAKVNHVKDILINKMNVKIGNQEVRLRKLEEKVTRLTL